MYGQEENTVGDESATVFPTTGGTFEFEFNKEEWMKINPGHKQYGGQTKIIRRRLQGNWTKTFASKTKHIYPGCVLSFKKHDVKQLNSRKTEPNFVKANGHCTGKFCHGNFFYTIKHEPVEPINDDTLVTVQYIVQGDICHVQDGDEINRRNINGTERQCIAEEIRKSSTSTVFSKNLLHAEEEC